MSPVYLRTLFVSLFGFAVIPSSFGQVQSYQPVGVVSSPSTETPSSGSPGASQQPTLQVRPVVQSLLLGRGDTIQISVYNELDMSQTVLVDDSGNIPLLMGGAVHVAGLSPGGAATAISNHLRDAQIMKDAHVVVAILSFGTQAVSVIGEVVKPGTIVLPTPRHILDVISLSGGFTPISDRVHVTVQHGSDPKNSETVILSNDPKISLAGNNVLVNPGDTVIVPRAPIVYVLGNVSKPGAYVMQYDSSMTVLQALTFAGGDLPDSNRGGIRLVRKTEGVSHELKVPVSDIEKGKAQDMQLLADDVLFVPFSYPKHWLMGGGSLITSGASTILYAVR